MRLGQLARKLELRPAEIVEFLGSNGITIVDHANTRLEDNQVMIIQKHFKPDYNNDSIVEGEDSPPSSEFEPVLPQPQIMFQSDEIDVVDEKPEVIKAPKVELSGLKIVGKIELPETKKKLPDTELQPEATDTDPSTVRPAKRVMEGARAVQRTENRSRRNPIAMQREREALEEKKKREEQAEREKERKTRNYYKKVKLSPPTKAMRIVDEPVMQMSARELEESPRTWFGRLMKWFTTA